MDGHFRVEDGTALSYGDSQVTATAVYDGFVRKSMALLACMALVLGFIQSPFTHVHEHEETSHHLGSFLHTHFHHHDASTSKMAQISDLDPDDDAHDLKWFSVAVDHFQLRIAPPQPFFSFEVVEASEPYVTPEIRSGHDPPDRVRSSPRAPPL